MRWRASSQSYDKLILVTLARCSASAIQTKGLNICRAVAYWITAHECRCAAQVGFHGYLVADSWMDYDLLEWFGEYSPSVGDVILGDLNNFSRTYSYRWIG